MAFEQLKEAMTSILVLAVPNIDELFVVEADAPSRGRGAVLMQEGRPVAYMNLTISNRAND